MVLILSSGHERYILQFSLHILRTLEFISADIILDSSLINFIPPADILFDKISIFQALVLVLCSIAIAAVSTTNNTL